MYTFIWAILFNINCFGQKITIDDSGQYTQLLQQADKLSNQNLDSALVLCKLISQKSQTAGLTKVNWDSKILESKLLFQIGQKDSALHILKKLNTETTFLKDTAYQIKSLTKLADIYQDSYEFKQAVEHLLNAQQLLTNTTAFDLRFNILNYLAQTHRKMKDYDSALKYYSILEHDYFFQLTPLEKFLVYMNTGNVYVMEKNYEKTEELYQKAYQEIIKIDDPVNFAQLTYNLGALYYRQKRYTDALEYTNRALKLYELVGNQQKIESCYRVLGAIAYDQKQYQLANEHYLKALEIAKEVNNPKSILGNYRNLFLNYQEMAFLTQETNYYDKALAYQSQWTTLKDSLYQVDLANQLLDLEKKYETEKKNAQIDVLERENLLKAEELMLQTQTRKYLILSVALLLAIVGIVLYFMVYYRRVNARLQEQSRVIFQQKEQITNQNTELQKAVNTQNKLFSIIAHDLRSPLVSVSNFVRLINYYLRDGRYDSIVKMAKEMDRKNEQVLELTDNLLNWAQSQSGELQPKLERICLNEILDECYELYQPVAERKEIELLLNETENCLIYADRDIIRTICRNLINNALKFTPRQGRVSIHCEYDKEYARVSISDTGLGISVEKVQRLFNPNKEDVRPGTDGEKSSGLGLSVCKEFCEILNGKITVDSEEGRGSTFRFSMPVFTGK